MKWLHETHPELIMNRTAYAIENYTPGHANNGAHSQCRNSSQRPFECKGDDDVVIPRPDSSETKASTAENNTENNKLS